MESLRSSASVKELELHPKATWGRVDRDSAEVVGGGRGGGRGDLEVLDGVVAVLGLGHEKVHRGLRRHLPIQQRPHHLQPCQHPSPI